MEKEFYWIWLTQLKGIGPVKERKMLTENKSVKICYEKFKDIYPETDEKAKRILERCKENNIKILTMDDVIYPDTFRKFNNLPIMLYYKGSLFESMSGVGVIGARRCSSEDKQKTIELTHELVKQNKIIVSGMAKGVDSYAHTAALKNNGKTIAVLGNGLNICYPKEHSYLMKSIEESGMLISEYPPDIMPTSYTFPQRNRIIAALSEKLYVVTAGRNSGTNITVDFAKKYGVEYDYK